MQLLSGLDYAWAVTVNTTMYSNKRILITYCSHYSWNYCPSRGVVYNYWLVSYLLRCNVAMQLIYHNDQLFAWDKHTQARQDWNVSLKNISMSKYVTGKKLQSFASNSVFSSFWDVLQNLAAVTCDRFSQTIRHTKLYCDYSITQTKSAILGVILMLHLDMMYGYVRAKSLRRILKDG